jgi:hypothetical protein
MVLSNKKCECLQGFSTDNLQRCVSVATTMTTVATTTTSTRPATCLTVESMSILFAWKVQLADLLFLSSHDHRILCSWRIAVCQMGSLASLGCTLSGTILSCERAGVTGLPCETPSTVTSMFAFVFLIPLETMIVPYLLLILPWVSNQSNQKAPDLPHLHFRDLSYNSLASVPEQMLAYNPQLQIMYVFWRLQSYEFVSAVDLTLMLEVAHWIVLNFVIFSFLLKYNEEFFRICGSLRFVFLRGYWSSINIIESLWARFSSY